MRKAASGFGLAVLAGIGGLAVVGLRASPAVGIVLGLIVVGAVFSYYAVGTEDLAMLGVGLLVFTITWNGIRLGGGNSNGTVGGGALGDATMVIAAAGVIAYVTARKRPLPLPPWLLLAGLGCFLSAVLVVIFPPSIHVMQPAVLGQATLSQQSGFVGPVGSLGQSANTINLIEYELSMLVVPILVAAVATTPRRCRRLIDVWVAGAVINGAVGVLNLGGLKIGSAAASGSRAAGLTIHPNYLALTCVIALPLAMLWFGRSRRFTIAAVLGVAALLGGVFASGSRAGTVAALIAVIGTVAVIPRLRRAIRYVLPIGGIALVALLAFTRTGHQLLHQVRLGGGGSNTTSGSNYQRSILAHIGWTQFKARPIEGVGFSVLISAHNIYLELLQSGGVIALASFLTFVGGLVASLKRALSGPLRDEAVVCAIAIAAWLLNGIFDNQIADKYLYVVPGLLVAIGRTSWLLRNRREVSTAERAVQPAAALESSPQALAGVGAP
jgi:O-antigen ligase